MNLIKLEYNRQMQRGKKIEQSLKKTITNFKLKFKKKGTNFKKALHKLKPETNKFKQIMKHVPNKSMIFEPQLKVYENRL